MYILLRLTDRFVNLSTYTIGIPFFEVIFGNKKIMKNNRSVSSPAFFISIVTIVVRSVRWIRDKWIIWKLTQYEWHVFSFTAWKSFNVLSGPMLCWKKKHYKNAVNHIDLNHWTTKIFIENIINNLFYENVAFVLTCEKQFMVCSNKRKMSHFLYEIYVISTVKCPQFIYMNSIFHISPNISIFPRRMCEPFCWMWEQPRRQSIFSFTSAWFRWMNKQWNDEKLKNFVTKIVH